MCANLSILFVYQFYWQKILFVQPNSAGFTNLLIGWHTLPYFPKPLFIFCYLFHFLKPYYFKVQSFIVNPKSLEN